jgi:hypothetical protein
MIVALPTARPWTNPIASTVAIAGEPDDHDTGMAWRSVPYPSVMRALAGKLSPCSTSLYPSTSIVAGARFGSAVAPRRRINRNGLPVYPT